MNRKRFILLCYCSLCVLSSCIKEDSAKEIASAKITLGVNADEYETRAINTLSDLEKIGDQIGIYGVTNWSEPAVMQNVRTTGVSAQTGMLYWEGSYYYPYHQQVRFYSYYPYAAKGEEGDNYMEEPAGSSPILHFTITGKEDLMYADPVVGSDNSPPASLAYNHLLTQFHFVLIDEGDFSETKIKRITFMAVKTHSTLHIENGELGDWSRYQSIIFPSSYPIQITGTEDSPQVIPGNIILQPGLKKMYIEIETTDKGTFSAVSITPLDESVFAAGRSYEITLKFLKNKDGDGGENVEVGIKAAAWVTPWKDGGDGSGSVEK